MNLLEAMRVYTRVVERAGISSAARDLGIGQSAVSERIERLEQFLGCQLLQRTTRAFKCTPEGEIFYTHSKQVVEAAAQAVSEVSRDHALLKGYLRISAPHCLGEGIIPEALRHLRDICPSMTFDLVLEDRALDLISEGVDLSFRLGRLTDGSFVACKLGQVPRMLVAAPSYLARASAIHGRDDLADHPFIRIKGDFDSEQLPLIDPWGHEDAAPIRTAMTTSHWRPMYDMLRSAAGIGVIKVPAGIDALRDGSLVPVLPGYEVPPLDLHLLIQSKHPFPLRIRHAVDEIRKCMPEILRARATPGDTR
ncbi:LysR family transcriptional regulator [Pandoraea vervacti]|uniref:LysR family transcriptional regulator n=1 Tax=Pandoraea vervacti TaxID=656178 RepID=A0ABM5SUZ3_9BURK|nr:LysR family transcriptional regulator [Pandoraea vervacti]AJP56283.1 LysR family transcriptional regulator [Pandoraea vervacti]